MFYWVRNMEIRVEKVAVKKTYADCSGYRCQWGGEEEFSSFVSEQWKFCRQHLHKTSPARPRPPTLGQQTWPARPWPHRGPRCPAQADFRGKEVDWQDGTAPSAVSPRSVQAGLKIHSKGTFPLHFNFFIDFRSSTSTVSAKLAGVLENTWKRSLKKKKSLWL